MNSLLIKPLNRIGKQLLLGLTVFLAPHMALAQTENPEEVLMSVLLVTVLLLAIVVLIYVLYALYVLLGALGQDGESSTSGWQQMKMEFLGIRPLEEEQHIEMHHEYDGIRELDNYLPPWWTYLFYLTIVFAIGYLLIYEVFEAAPSQAQEYQNEIVLAAQQAKARKLLAGGSLDESNVEASTDATELANGEKIYTQLCVACHRADGGGGVGPNLTDEYWIHGGGIADLFGTVKYGVPQKGMISWQSQLSPTDMRDVSSYILTLGGTNPANPKEAQGELYKP